MQQNQSLMNYDFQGYKLVPFDSFSFHKIYPTDIDSKANLSHPSLKLSIDRYHFNHLFSNLDNTFLLYIDSNYRIIQLKELNSECVQKVVYVPTIPNLELEKRHFPSIVFLDHSTCLFNDGCCSLYFLDITENEFNLRFTSTFDYPFTLKHAFIKPDSSVHCLVQSIASDQVPHQFRIECISISPDLSNSHSTIYSILIREPCLYANIDSATSFVLGLEHTPETEINYTKTSNHSNSNSTYNWSQTETDITIFLRLTSSTISKYVNARFTKSHLHLSILEPSLKIFSNELYDLIDNSGSLWTLESSTLLTLYLEKQNPIMWPTVFKIDDGVIETTDLGLLLSYQTDLDSKTEPLKNNTFSEPIDPIDYQKQSLNLIRYEITNNQVEITHQNNLTGYEYCCHLQNDLFLGYDIDSNFYFKSNKVLRFNIKQGLEFTHTMTYNAMNFIKNSKQDRKFVFMKHTYCLVVENKRYLYIYESDKDSITSYQMILDLCCDDGSIIPNIVGVNFVGDYVVLLREDDIVAIRLES